MKKTKHFARRNSALKVDDVFLNEEEKSAFNEQLVNMLLFPKDNLAASMQVVSLKPSNNKNNANQNTSVKSRLPWLKLRTKEEYQNARILKKNFNETWEGFKSRFYQEIKVIKSMLTINEGSL